MSSHSRPEAAGIHESSHVERVFERKNQEEAVMPYLEQLKNDSSLFSDQKSSKAKRKTLRVTEEDMQKRVLDKKLLVTALSVLGVIVAPFAFFLLGYLPEEARNFVFSGVVSFIVLTFLTAAVVQAAYKSHNKVKS